MTIETKYAPRRTALPTLMLAALALAGCSSGNIGDSWQCPLAKGGSCDSVAAADPAVPERKAAGGAALREPLWRLRAAEPNLPAAREPALPAQEPAPDAIRGPGQAAESACPADCNSGFDPFGWLARLFQAEGGGNADGGGQDDIAAAAPRSAAPMPPPDAEPGEAAAARTVEPASPALPAEPAPGEEHPGGDDLRTGEVVARIWIAPFVDAGGVYREASHVRVVLEPAGWRLPR